MSIKRGRGGGDFYLETARCHKHELGDEARTWPSRQQTIWCSKEQTSFFFDERISLAVVVRRATFWRDQAYGLRIYCASRIFVKATAGRQGREGTENPDVPTAKTERPEEAKQVDHLEEEGNVMQLEGEQIHEQAWAWTMST